MSATTPLPTEREGAWRDFGALPGDLLLRPRLQGLRADVLPSPAVGTLGPVAVAARVHAGIAPLLDTPGDELRVEVPAGAELREPIVLALQAAPGDLLRLTRTEVLVGAGARCTIHELVDLRAPATLPQLRCASTVVRVAAGARCTWRTTVTTTDGSCVLLARELRLGAGAEGALDLELSGTGRAHLTDTQRVLASARATLSSAVRIGGAARFGHDVLQELDGEAAYARLSERLVAEDLARGTFISNAHLTARAQRADAAQSHRALLRSDQAASNATPSLEIEADDVRCSHGATTSRLDDEVRFYLRARGIPEAETDTMLMEAFLAQAQLTPLAPLTPHPATR